MTKELTHIADIAAFLADEPELFVVYDRNVEWVAKEIPGAKASLALDASEEGKTLETVQEIGRFLMRENASRAAAGPLSVRETANAVEQMLRELPSKKVEGTLVKIPLFYCKAVNLWKRFVISVKSGSLKRKIMKLLHIGGKG